MVDLYKIGTVAKRTGISPERLRAWERRYGLEPAERAGQTRFYSAEQMDRLSAIKRLLDQGHPISQVIELDAAELQRRIHPPRSQPQPHRGRVGLVGSQLIHALRTANDAELKPTAEWASLADLEADQDALPSLDVVVIFLPSLNPQSIELLEEMYPAAGIGVTFKYTTKADLEQLKESGYALLRWPASWAAVEELVADSQPSRAVGAARLYDDDELCHIREMASRTACECCANLAALVGELNDFAIHANRCDGDEDHALIEEDLHAARAQLEQSLQSLVEKHGLLTTAN